MSDVRSGVLAAHRALYDAVESGDLDLMASLWVDSADTVCVHPAATPLRGSTDVVRSWMVLMANVDYLQFFLTDIEVAVLPPGDADPRVAVVTCTENMLSGGDAAPADLSFGAGAIVSTNVLVRDGGGWRFWQRHASPVATAHPEEDA